MINPPDQQLSIDEKIIFIRENSHGAFTEVLGMDFLEIHPLRMVARMPVEQRVKQPFGILHGGASVGLAESLASIGAWLHIDSSRFLAVGMEINANHIRPVSEGSVLGRAIPIHVGRTTHIWEIKITLDETDKLVCISRCTMAIVPRGVE